MEGTADAHPTGVKAARHWKGPLTSRFARWALRDSNPRPTPCKGAYPKRPDQRIRLHVADQRNLMLLMRDAE